MSKVEQPLACQEKAFSFDTDGEVDLMFPPDMEWTKPQYSNRQIDEAGITLNNKLATPEERNAALDIIDNFKASHNFPLNTIQVWLRKNAKGIVVQRIKRLPSIEKKLKRIKWLSLSQMQDIGGCRAILQNVSQVYRLNQKYKESRIRHKLIRTDDYIEHPKKSGYRGIHLIYEYYSDANTVYNGQLIEIQVRTPLQHAWATAVETVDTYTNQVLKAGGGKEEWKKFFRLVGTVMAIHEKRPLVPNTPTDNTSLKIELHKYNDQIRQIKTLKAYGEALQKTKRNLKGARHVILTLNLNAS